MLADQGKSSARSHENDYDTQLAYKDFLYYRKNSVLGALKASTHMRYSIFTTVEVWKGAEEIFILCWKDKLRVLEPTVTNDAKLS